MGNLENNLFINSGNRLKRFATIYFVIVVIAGVIGGIAQFIGGANNDNGILILSGLLTPFVSALMGYLTSLPIYAFGELVEHVLDIRNKTCNGNENKQPVHVDEKDNEVETTINDNEKIIQELNSFKELLEIGAISQEDYDKKEKELFSLIEK